MKITLLLVHAHLANLISPPPLVGGFDETMVQVVPNRQKTRTTKGEKKVRVQHVGNEKALSCTGTIFYVAATPESFGYEGNGDILETQLIFKGTTDACHPKKGKGATPEGLMYTHTESNWQTPTSMIEATNKILVPWRKRVIAALRSEGKVVPDDQQALLLSDLHYSHHDKAVLANFEKHNFKVLHIPAKMTDEKQVGDTRLNKPYKAAFNAEFNIWADEAYAKWRQENPDDLVGNFRLTYKTSVLKPLLPRFVLAGRAALMTPAMRKSITDGFFEEGSLGEMYSEERKHAAFLHLTQMQEEKEEDDAAAEALEEEQRALHQKHMVIGVLSEYFPADVAFSTLAEPGVSRRTILLCFQAMETLQEEEYITIAPLGDRVVAEEKYDQYSDYRIEFSASFEELFSVENEEADEQQAEGVEEEESDEASEGGEDEEVDELTDHINDIFVEEAVDEEEEEEKSKMEMEAPVIADVGDDAYVAPNNDGRQSGRKGAGINNKYTK